MRSLFPNFGLSRKVITSVIMTAFGLWILLINRELFFQGNRVIRSNSVMNPAVDIPFETHRALIFWLLIAFLAVALLDGMISAWGKGADKKLYAFRHPVPALLWTAAIVMNSVLCFYEIELINNYYIANMEMKYRILNIGITLALCLIFIFMTNSVVIGMQIANMFFVSWGTANYYVQRFRGSPLQWVDFSSIRTATTVAGTYDYKPNWELIACAVVSICIFLMYGNRHIVGNVRRTGLKIASRVLGLGIFAAFCIVLFRTDFLANQGIWLRDWQPWYTYRLFGVESGFFAFAKASFPSAPAGYSSSRTKQIIKESKEETASESWNESDVVPENILVIMNEAFSDLTIYPGFKADRPMMPFIDSLTDNTQTGNMLVSVRGGTTCNTEYEFLTGNSCVLSPSTVVFTSFIKDKQFSIADILSAQGYRSYGMHPYKPNGWSRNIVYPRMGLEFLNIENAFRNADTLRGYVSDSGDYAELIKMVEDKEPGEKLFLFNVTMQNHSAYTNPDYEPTVHVLDYQGKSQAAADQYCSLILESDNAVRDLIDYFSRSDEKTLIVFYGDHQPEISDDFWTYCQGKTEDSLDFAEQQMSYMTRYFIWANYDIPEAKNQTLSANYLAAHLLSLTGLDMSGYNRFLLDQRSTIPVMNAYGYLGTDGGWHEWDEKADTPEAEQLNRYECLIYNELTGGSSRDASFFTIDKPAA